MKKLTVKYSGETPTLIRAERNSPKIEVVKGDVIEVDEDIAKGLVRSFKHTFTFVGAAPKDEEVLCSKCKGEVDEDEDSNEGKKEGKVEGGLDEGKVEKTVPKTATKGKK